MAALSNSLFFVLGLMSFCAHAQNDQNVVNEPAIQVTATRQAQTVDASLADVTVITRADIDASGAADLYDLLRTQAGVDVARSGGAGEQTALFLRGTNSNHVLVLVDGVRIASTGTGGVDFSLLPLDAIERIEIVRGPRAAYWGSDAIGGVVQVFTRRLNGPAAAVQYGSYDDASASAGIGDWNDRGGFSVLAGIRHVRGFSAENPEGFSYDPDDDGLRNRNLAARGEYKVGPQTLSANALYSDSVNEFDQGTSHTIEHDLGAALAGDVTARWFQKLSIGSARDDLDTPDFFELFRSRRQSATWLNIFTLDEHQSLTAGVERVHESGENVDTFANADVFNQSHDNTALFGGWSGHLQSFDWEVAARHDHNSVFGGATTGSGAIGWRIAPALRLTASFGQGFRAPSLNEQFSPGFGGLFAGNPDLRPERSRSSEIGAEWTPADDFSAKLSVYHTDIDNLIDFTGPLFQAENTERARIDGAEVEAHWHRDGWRIDGNATWQNARDPQTGEHLLRRASRKGDVALTRLFGDRLNACLELYAEGPRPDLGGPLPGYALINAHLNFILSHVWQLHLRAENLTNRTYSLIRGYNTPGRSGWIELAWSPHGN
ncbi:MAG TPA: TonB-dependent receptor [Rhodanobacteraceae bacterium]|nr:TonB-dependent receptor [Rhodanobacteraceae bacterium]